MAKYPVNVQDLPARELIITEKSITPTRREPFYQYLPNGVDLPVIHVEIGLPVYRMANWRTRMKQMDYIHKQPEGFSHEYFQNGEEDVGPQRVQHEILVDFAERGRGDSIIPIIQKLRQDRRQMEALLITSTGVVVNGNRRLAAMRELFADDPGNFPFQQIEVAVLPAGVTAQDLKKIEFQLQMQQETKLPYDWAIQCLSVKELVASGTPHLEIMHMMRLNRVEEVQAMINRLNEAEMYLNDYLQTPENYAAIEGQQQQFLELQRALDRKSDSGEKELARKMCYIITKHSRDLETRAYDFKIAFGAKTTEVASRLAERMNIELPEQGPAPAADNADSDDDDVFADEATAEVANRFQPVSQVLSDTSQSAALAEAIAEICTEIKEEGQGEQDAKKPLKLVRKAKSVLSTADLDKAGADTLGEIQSELAAVIELAEALQGKVVELQQSVS